jgi:hypothetical protein
VLERLNPDYGFSLANTLRITSQLPIVTFALRIWGIVLFSIREREKFSGRRHFSVLPLTICKFPLVFELRKSRAPRKHLWQLTHFSRIRMSLSNFVQQIEKLLPDEHADRILLVAKIIRSGNLQELPCSVTEDQVRIAISRIQSLDEQLGAAAWDLDNLAAATPSEFEPSHVWTLIRTIKVQSQMLDLIYHPMDKATLQTSTKN